MGRRVSEDFWGVGGDKKGGGLHCVNWPTLGFQCKSCVFSVLCHFQYFVRE